VRWQFLLYGFFAAGCKQQGTATAPASEPNQDSLVTLFTGIARQEDMAAWSRHFAHTPSVYWICVEDDVTLQANGWSDLEKFVGTWMKANPVPEADSSLKKEVTDDLR
jgi:hypothetical protein